MCGGLGSGSKPGKQANRYVDGRFLYASKIPHRGGRMVGHIKPIIRDKWGNPSGPPQPELNAKSNLKLVTRSANAKGPSRKNEKSVKKKH